MELKEKVALITGSSRGIGAEIAKKFAANGVFVVVNYPDSKDEAIKVIEQIKAQNGEAIAIKANVANEEEVENMVNEVISLKGKIDILVNNATRKLKLADITKLTWNDFEDEINVGIRGTFNSTKAVLKSMIEHKNGVIVNIISSACTGTPPPNFSAYVTSKMGLSGLSKCMAVDLAKHNIRVNMVSPGTVDTELTSFIPPIFKQKIAEETLTKRLTTKEDVANAVLFLVSDEGAQINGVDLLINGGNPIA